MADALDCFSEPTRAWFRASVPQPTAAQEQGWQAITAGRHTLILTPSERQGPTWCSSTARLRWYLERGGRALESLGPVLTESAFVATPKGLAPYR